MRHFSPKKYILCQVFMQKAVAKNCSFSSQKRPGYTPITFDGDSPAAKKVNKQEARKLYAPPTGRWSDNAGTYQGTTSVKSL